MRHSITEKSLNSGQFDFPLNLQMIIEDDDEDEIQIISFWKRQRVNNISDSDCSAPEVIHLEVEGENDSQNAAQGQGLIIISDDEEEDGMSDD